MNGPEHYREAERLAEQSLNADYGDEEFRMRLAAVAQVHATLALAAATAELNAIEGPGGGSATGRLAEQGRAWTELLAALRNGAS